MWYLGKWMYENHSAQTKTFLISLIDRYPPFEVCNDINQSKIFVTKGIEVNYEQLLYKVYNHDYRYKKTDIYYLLSNFGRHTGNHDSASLNASEACTILSSICKSWGCRTNCFSLTRVTSWLLLIRTANTKSWKMKMKETMIIVSPMLTITVKEPKAHIQKPSTWKKYLPFQYQSASCQWKVLLFNNRIWVLVVSPISSAQGWYATAIATPTK